MRDLDPRPVALPLLAHCIHLAPDGAMRPVPKTAENFRRAAADAGHLLALHPVNGPRDVHYPTWEMHPVGDELLIAASGSLSVELREGASVRTAPLPAQAACIVPAGVWHRLVVHEPSVLIAMTPRQGTVHEKDPLTPPACAA